MLQQYKLIKQQKVKQLKLSSELDEFTGTSAMHIQEPE